MNSSAPTAYQLRTCVWELTLACSFSCAYCGSGGGRPRKNELSLAECLEVARQLGDLGCDYVSLIGGEVFMRPDWRPIVAELISCGVRVCIITNGFALTDDQIAELVSIGVESVAVSLDGPEEVHDLLRQKGSHYKAIQSLKRLSSAGMPCSVITTLNSQNAPLLQELFDELAQLPLAAWQLQACAPMGNASKAGIDYRFDVDQVMDFVRLHQKLVPFPMGIAHNIGYGTDDDAVLRCSCNSVGFRGCPAGLTGIGIDSVGNVRGCESMYDERFVEGNLRERSLRDIWEAPDSFAYNRKFDLANLEGACASCSKAPRCAAGCRSYNYFTTGGLYESTACSIARNR